METSIEFQALKLKLLGKKSKKNILISAGKESDKLKMLTAIKELSEFNVDIFATQGTSVFLHSKGVKNQQIFKITEKQEPNILSFLNEDKFDLVINVLVGNHDYDESTDSNLIRKLSIENGIPLITDVDVGIWTINKIVNDLRSPQAKTNLTSLEPWNLKAHFFDRIKNLGGLACHHAHFDKAYLINLENLRLGQVDMQKKWDLYEYLKENYSHQDLVTRISRGLQKMVSQGVTYCRTLVDADKTVKLLPIKAALEVKHKFKDQIDFQIGIQPLQGVLEKESQKYFVQACEMADFIGGLPSKDRPTPEKHIDFLMSLSKTLNKPVDVHIDQENNPDENETELLARKTIEHGLEGKVFGIHAISLAAKPQREQRRILKLVKDSGIGIVICPSAAISMKSLDKEAPLHNSIAPLAGLLEFEIPVYLGIDNIADLFMPMVDGDMWFEARLLMEACRFYEVDRIAEISCRRIPGSFNIKPHVEPGSLQQTSP